MRLLVRIKGVLIILSIGVVFIILSWIRMVCVIVVRWG